MHRCCWNVMMINEITQAVAADWLSGKFLASGRLPVSVCNGIKAGFGITLFPGCTSGSACRIPGI